MNETPQKPKRKAQPIQTQDYYFKEALIRTFLQNGEPWFVLSDACAVLKHTDPSKAAERLDENEKGTNIIRTPGGPQSCLVISESGLYKLILTARTEGAKEFQDWVTGTVLPSIRKTGHYDLKDDPTFAPQQNASAEGDDKLSADQQEQEGPFQPRLEDQLDNNEANEDYLRLFIGLTPEQRTILKALFTMPGIYTVYVSKDKQAEPIINRIETTLTLRDLDYLQAKSIAMMAMLAQTHIDTLLTAPLGNKDFLRSSYWQALEQTVTHGFQLAERFLFEQQWMNSSERKLGKEGFTN